MGSVKGSDKSMGKIRILVWDEGKQFPLTRSSSSFRRAERINFAPFLANSYASASPIPEDAPVSQMTLLFRVLAIRASVKQGLLWIDDDLRHRPKWCKSRALCRGEKK